MFLTCPFLWYAEDMPRTPVRDPEPMITTTVKMPRELHKRLRIAVIERGETASEIIRQALEVELKKKR